MATLTERVLPTYSIRVRGDGDLDGVIEVEEMVIILRDGMPSEYMSPASRRYTLEPGMDLTGKEERIRAIADAVWTPEVVAAFQAAYPPPPAPPGEE